MTDVIIPTKQAELEEMLADPAKLQNLFADPKTMQEWATNYARSVYNKDKDLTQQIQEQVALGIQDFLQETGGHARKVDLSGAQKVAASSKVATGKGAAYNAKAPGAYFDDVFDDAAELFQAFWHKRDTLRNRETLNNKMQKVRDISNAYQEAVPSSGGFLVPEVMRAEILSIALESAVVRPRARVIPMSSLRVPIPMVDSTTNVGSVFGGIIAYWTEESAAITESQGTFGRVVLDAKKLAALANVSNELLADAPAFNAWFQQIFPAAVAWYEDTAFLTGTGVGEPKGVLTSNALIQVAEEATQSANTIVWENVIKMYARMLPSSLGNAVWVVSPATFPELAAMALSVGTGGSAIWLNNGVAGPPMTILGRPVIISEKVPTLGTNGDLNFIDFGYYLIGDRQAIELDSSSDYRFANDETSFRVIERVDGRPWLQSAVTPANGGDTLSPFVQMGTRS